MYIIFISFSDSCIINGKVNEVQLAPATVTLIYVGSGLAFQPLKKDALD